MQTTFILEDVSSFTLFLSFVKNDIYTWISGLFYCFPEALYLPVRSLLIIRAPMCSSLHNLTHENVSNTTISGQSHLFHSDQGKQIK